MTQRKNPTYYVGHPDGTYSEANPQPEVAPSRSAAPTPLTSLEEKLWKKASAPHIAGLCPKCGIGLDTNGDGDCSVCSSPAYQQRASADQPSPTQCPACTGSKDLALCAHPFHSPDGVKATNEGPDGAEASAAPPSEREAATERLLIDRSLVEGLRSFMNRRFDQDRLLKYQTHFMRELDAVLARAAVPQAAPQTPDRAEAIKTLVDDWNDGVLDAPILLEQAYEFGFKAGAAAAPAPGTVGSATPIGQEEAMKSSLRKIVGKQRRVLGETVINGETVEIAVFDEVLECGHVQAVRQDMYGETLAAKRRCKECVAGATAPPKEGK